MQVIPVLSHKSTGVSLSCISIRRSLSNNFNVRLCLRDFRFLENAKMTFFWRFLTQQKFTYFALARHGTQLVHCLFLVFTLSFSAVFRAQLKFFISLLPTCISWPLIFRLHLKEFSTVVSFKSVPLAFPWASVALQVLSAESLLATFFSNLRLQKTVRCRFHPCGLLF